jgi:hypothetical protein
MSRRTNRRVLKMPGQAQLLVYGFGPGAGFQGRLGEEVG